VLDDRKETFELAQFHGGGRAALSGSLRRR
jgi:hypothetical protein